MKKLIGGTSQDEQSIEDIQDLIHDLGPRRVKTNDMEIEAHDPAKMQKLLERRATKQVALSQFGKQIARRKLRDHCDRCY